MLGFLFGNKDSFNLENRIYISSTLLGVAAGIVAIIWDANLGLPIILNVVVGLAVVIYSILYYYSRFRKIYNSFVFIFSTLCLLSVLWMLNEGSMGSMPALYIVFISIFIGISKPKYHLMFLIITLVNLTILIILENLYYDELIIQYPSAEAKESDIIFGYGASLIIIYLISSYFKRTFDKEKKEISDQKIELQKLNSSKDLLFNIIAHDLRNPISNILGFTDIMTDKSNNLTIEEIQELADLSKKSSENASELLESLLEWGKIQQGKIHINPQSINLKQASVKSIEFFKEKYTDKEIEITIQVPSEINVFTDLHILQTIYRNLISNAIKFTAKGGSICISTEENNDDNVIIVIEDSGIGMNKNIFDNLFNLEINTNRGGTDGESSSGLGLIICKELVEKLGGELKVESVLDKGSKFKFKVQKN